MQRGVMILRLRVYIAHTSLMSLKKLLVHTVLFLLFALTSLQVVATHYRAGEIYYQQISGRTIRATVVTFTDPQSPANEFTVSVTIVWGDGTLNEAPRTSIDRVSANAQRNVYVLDHTYQTDGSYVISVTDPNRVNDIVNINSGRSDQVPFFVQSLIRISGSIGNNTSPILTVPPLVDGCEQFFYLHNPGAYDPDGDSLVFSIGIPKQGKNDPVPNYVEPMNSDSFTIDPQTGKLYWVKPLNQGLYNIVIRVSEYRQGVLVGYVERDMQIRIRICINQPPNVSTYADRCVNAGDTVNQLIVSNDIDIQVVTIRGYGGPFNVPNSPATLSPNPGSGTQVANTLFSWKTNCSHIRNENHTAIFESKDDFSVPMANYTSLGIRVVGPKPTNIQLKQIGNGFLVSWNPDSCRLANAYKIYRKTDSSFFTPAQCQVGMPDTLGFELIGNIPLVQNGPVDTFFYDNNKGEGLSPLVNYCYRIVAVFPPRNANGNVNGNRPSESYVSDEVCDAIIRSKPIITNVSVRTTDIINGSIELTWIRPDTLDTTIYTPPYRLRFNRAQQGSGPLQFTSFLTTSYNTFASIPDSTIIDTLINTSSTQWVYKIELQWDSLGVATTVDASPNASSVFASIFSTDNTNILSWRARVPWTNNSYTVFKQNETSLEFDSIATVDTLSYKDTGLVNGRSYCYFVVTKGAYSFFNSPLLNSSQQICGIPIDTIQPCPPILSVQTPCETFGDFTNKLSWIPKPACADDVVKYRVYYKRQVQDTFELLSETLVNINSYNDSRDTLRYSIAGCYAVTGIDSFNNQSPFTNTICVDNCPFYRIPNVFTPDGDLFNELLKPFEYRFIDRIDLKIYNRWGTQVYGTQDLEIDWNGTDQTNGKPLSSGVYYYTLEVYQRFLNEMKVEKLSGTIQLIR